MKKNLKVLARASADDKLILVAGIKSKLMTRREKKRKGIDDNEPSESKAGIVGMTGEGISDAFALKEADVGFCMGSGCDVSKDSSDLIVQDNRFESIYKAMLWGQATFNNIKKFAQF